jgi:predicted RNA-binding Zn-ribbon protein involved in translation (DUF1610 family)
MSDDEFKKELAEAAKNPNLESVETKATKAEMIIRFKCPKCGEKQDFPEHCDQQMNYIEDGHKLECEVCGESQAAPQHCDTNMGVFIDKV